MKQFRFLAFFVAAILMFTACNQSNTPTDNTDNTDYSGEDTDAHCFGISFSSCFQQRGKCIGRRGEQTDWRRRYIQSCADGFG